MSGVQQVALLMVLVGGVLVGGDHHQHPEPEDCDALTKRLSTAELDKVLGDWVLVWSVADADEDLVGNISTSLLRFRQLDNRTVELVEENVYLSNTTSCTVYNGNMSLEENQNLTLKTHYIRKDTDGDVQHYNESGEVHFYETSRPHRLLMVYTASQSGRYTLSYRREGHHQDVEEQKASHDFLKKQAECLKFSTDGAYVYDGVSDFCHKKS